MNGTETTSPVRLTRGLLALVLALGAILGISFLAVKIQSSGDAPSSSQAIEQGDGLTEEEKLTILESLTPSSAATLTNDEKEEILSALEAESSN